MDAWFDNNTSVDYFKKVSEFTVISQKFDRIETSQGTQFFFIVLFSFEAFRCSAYLKVILKRGKLRFKSKWNYSHEVSKILNFPFPNSTVICSLTYS